MNGEADSNPIVLPAALDPAAADGLLELMRQSMGGKTPPRFDASAVGTLSLPCLQILLAAAGSHGRLAVTNPSAAFVGAFADLGLDWISYLDEGPELASPQMQDGEAPAAVAQERGADEPVTMPRVESGQDAVVVSQAQANGEAAEMPHATAAEGGGMPAESGAVEPDQTNGCAVSKRILTIDDSKTMRDMLMITLAEAGFDVLQAVDGQDGLDVMSREQVDVVITDINMPKMDGYEVIRQLRKKPELRALPILVLTTESELEKRNVAREAGATGWMVKPFDPDRLVATVRKVSP